VTQTRILIVGSSLHHSKNIVFLVREMIRMDGSIHATLVCYGSQKASYAELLQDSPVQLVAFEGEGFQAAAAQSFEVSVSRTGFLKGVLMLKTSLARLPRSIPLLRKQLERWIAWAKESTPALLIRERAVIARLRQEKRMAEQLFDHVRPTVIMAFGDRHPDLEAPILRVARDRGIKVMVPYTTYSGKDILVEVRRNDPHHTVAKPASLYRSLKARRFSDQVHEGLFYQPPHLLAAYEEFGALSTYPWCLGNGLSDAVCVDNAITAERYRRDRVPGEKIRIVGDVVYDKVADTLRRRCDLREALMAKYGFDRTRKLIAVALPQLAEQGLMEWDEHWKEMRFLVDALSREGQSLLISLHPRMKTSDYAFLEKEYHCRIAEERFADFVSVPDVFVANYSSTVIWAVLCGVRCVVVDFYGLNYRFFDYLRSVRIIRDRGRLAPALAAALHDPPPDFSEDWRALSREAVLDGNTIQRYYDLVDELSASSARY
jgi:hypothetical protein